MPNLLVRRSQDLLDVIHLDSPSCPPSRWPQGQYVRSASGDFESNSSEVDSGKRVGGM